MDQRAIRRAINDEVTTTLIAETTNVCTGLSDDLRLQEEADRIARSRQGLSLGHLPVDPGKLSQESFGVLPRIAFRQWTLGTRSGNYTMGLALRRWER